MSETLGSDFFAGNRQRLRQLFTGTAPIVLTANGQLQRSRDEAYPFRQDSNFWYLTGCDDHDVILVMDKAREYLIVPKRDATIETFDGAIDVATLASKSGIKEILNEKEGWKLLEARLKKVQHVATLAANPPYMDFYGMYANPARARLIRRIKKAHADIELLDLSQHLSRMRMIKQPAELLALRQAMDITIDTLKDVTKLSRLAKYAHEYELEADITHGFRKRGAEGHAFSPIVAGGLRACTLHNMANNGALMSDELVILDVGASASHYAADISRTVALHDHPSRRQQQVHEAVCAAQEYAFSLLKPGTMLREYERQIEAFVGEKLRELGLIKSITHEAVRDSLFPHATSHFLGLDAHDAGDYDRPIESGVVLAVEPGIYIRDEGIGVRIEDNVLITEDGIEVITARLPRALA